MDILTKQKCRTKNFCGAIMLLSAGLLVVPSKAQIVDTVSISAKQRTVLFGTQNSDKTVQSYSSVDGSRLQHRATFHIGASLYGTLPSLQPYMTSGLASAQMQYSLRGSMPTIMVDGVPRSSINIPAEQIESVTIIKDALGASMYGMMGGGGIVNIITKKGAIGKLNISFTAQFALSEEIFKPKYLNSYDYATLFNEAAANSGRNAAYSQSDLDMYKNGTNVYTHPDTDWRKFLLKDTAPIQKYNLNFMGGSSTVRYLVDMNFYDQKGFVKQDKSINPYPTENTYQKYSLRSRIDVDVTKNTLLEVNLFGQMFKENSLGTSLTGFYNDINNTPNNAYAPINPDGSLGATSLYTNNLYGQSIYAGYKSYNATDLNMDVRLTHKLNGALEGMYVSGLYSFNSIYRETLDRSKTRTIYSYGLNPDGTDLYTKLATSGAQANSSSYNKQNRMQQVDLTLGYDFKSGLHSSNNKVVYYSNNYLIDNYLPFINTGISGNFQYDYDKRFLAEVAISYSKMNQYTPDKQWGFFPSIGLGWNISNESWFENTKSTINNLKLRASYGMVGDNQAGFYFDNSAGTTSYYYDYQHFYQGSSTAYFGNTATGYNTLAEGGLAYATTWQKNYKLNIGVDASFLNDKFTVSVDYFNNKMTDMLMFRGTNASSIIGIKYPLENIGKVRVYGAELSAAYNGRSGDFSWIVDGNVTLTQTKALFLDEADRPYEYMSRTGKPYGQYFGYTADGIFQNQQEVDAFLATTKVEGYTPKAGDIRYKDINGDNIIDDRDVQAIGTQAPYFAYGLYGGFSWKGIGFNMQWAGLANRQAMITDMPFGVDASGAFGQATENQMADRWTPTNPNADYPRFTLEQNINNQQSSTFWLKNSGFLRLKHIEVSYDLPKQWVSTISLKKVKFFATAYNLLTITPLKDRDPELLGYNNIPNIKSYSFGVNIQF